MGADYYKTLGISRDAGEDEIKKAYKKMVCDTFHMLAPVQVDILFAGSEMASRPQWRV